MKQSIRSQFLVIILALGLTACASKGKQDEPSADDQTLRMAQVAFQEGEHRRAVNYLLPLAHQGNDEAQYALGYAFYEGLGVPQDRMQAYFWIQESAQQGNESALYALEIFGLHPDLPQDGSQEALNI